VAVHEIDLSDTFPALLQAARDGESWAFERIYLDYASLVIGYVRAHGARDPEDMTQDVFVSLVRGLDRFTGDERDFRSWLLTIAHRRLVDDLRRRGRRPVTVMDVIDLRDRPTHRTLEEESLARLEASGVLSLIDQLTPDQRSVLLLRLLADLSVPEIAAVVGKPETAVKALLRRGQAALLRRLDADGTVVSMPMAASGSEVRSAEGYRFG
jgi:RNA polymerase sigma-70 factor (ECF subfamily)